MNKKILLFVIFFISFCVFIFAEEITPVYKGCNIYLDVLNKNNKTICKDNIVFVNKTKLQLDFMVDSITDKQPSYSRFLTVTVKPEESFKTESDLVSTNYKTNSLKLTCINATLKISKVESKSDDLFIYIEEAKEIDNTITKKGRALIQKFLQEGQFICVEDKKGDVDFITKNSINNILEYGSYFYICFQRVGFVVPPDTTLPYWDNHYTIFYEINDAGEITNVKLDEKNDLYSAGRNLGF